MVWGRVTRMASVEVVDAGGEEEVFAVGELRVDGGGVVAVGVRDVELRDGD